MALSNQTMRGREGRGERESVCVFVWEVGSVNMVGSTRAKSEEPNIIVKTLLLMNS